MNNRRLAAIFLMGALLAGACTSTPPTPATTNAPANAGIEEPKSTLFDTSGLRAPETRDVLGTDYAPLTGAARQEWIDLFAMQFVDGFYRSPPTDGSTLEASGDSTTDIVTINATFATGDMDSDILASLISLMCGEEAWLWAIGQGITMRQTYTDAFGKSVTADLNAEVCSAAIESRGLKP